MNSAQVNHTPGTHAAEHLSPAFPSRAPWGTVNKLRAWQEEAINEYFKYNHRDFLAAATPGAGKTTFALRIATELRGRGIIRQVVVVAPTEHLKNQWADAAARVGIKLNPNFSNNDRVFSSAFHGVAVTYAQVAMKPEVHRDIILNHETLVILDEVHHAGDALTWGDAIREAYERATRRLSLSGTPFRSDTAPIPFVNYEENKSGIRISKTDYNYGYGRGLSDGIVRPVIFMVYSGEMKWQTKTGDVMEARLSDDNTKDITSLAWRTALDPEGEWISSVLVAANKRLSEVRYSMPDAGGLVIASDQERARAYANLLAKISGEKVTLVLSDDNNSSEEIDKFSHSTSRWMVAVRMVSEGVDVPRLAVGVYATSAATPLFFAQAIGRFVRSRRRGETASIFIPKIPHLLTLASTMELERDHALDRVNENNNYFGNVWQEEDTLAINNRSESASDALTYEYEYKAISSAANFDHALYDGDNFGGYADINSEEELDFIGLPGILEPDQVKELLIHRQSRQAKRYANKNSIHEVVPDKSLPPEPLFRSLKEQRKLLNTLVSLYAKKTNEAHALIHAELRRISGGPPVAQASSYQLQKRINILRKRLSD